MQENPFAGIVITPYFPKETSDENVVWERWTHCGMGFVSSPYTAVQDTLIAEEVIRGDPHDQNTVFQWDDIILILPGGPNYLPHNPWVYKVRFDGDHSVALIANDLKIYVDDVHTMGNSYVNCRRASCVVASTINCLGIQDARRK